MTFHRKTSWPQVYVNPPPPWKKAKLERILAFWLIIDEKLKYFKR
jgi:hypothetical protein